MIDKQALRADLRRRRADHEAAIPDAVRALLFVRPPSPLLDLIPKDAVIGVYYPVRSEASPLGYARWFAERGHPVALPWFAQRGAPMEFRRWENPFDADDLVDAPYGGMQPPANAPVVTPDVLIVPLLGFTAQGQRLGQGGGHYDSYLADHVAAIPIGIAWDCQLEGALPTEPHDMPLRAVVTPTRFFGPF